MHFLGEKIDIVIIMFLFEINKWLVSGNLIATIKSD